MQKSMTIGIIIIFGMLIFGSLLFIFLKNNKFSNLDENYKLEGIREGDGFWNKSELTFYIKDEKNVLTEIKREAIKDSINSKKESEGGFLGWNAALKELNNLYPNNSVPDGLVETDNESMTDFLIIVNVEKEFCCDLNGNPIIGRERSEINLNDIKIKSRINLYNILEIDIGFLGDVTRHEIGHGLGLFGHVIDRENDLMSLISPDSEIKKGNLEDLYIKYRDREVETIEEMRVKDSLAKK